MQGMGPGRVLGGRYRVGSQVGSGGYGRVWTAYDEVLRVEVAVEEVGAAGSEGTARAVRTVHVIAGLRDHPNVLPVNDIVEADGVVWTVMPLVSGPSLADHLAEHGRMSRERVMEVAAAVLGALDAMRGVGFVHGDVRSANIRLDGVRWVLLPVIGAPWRGRTTRRPPRTTGGSSPRRTTSPPNSCTEPAGSRAVTCSRWGRRSTTLSRGRRRSTGTASWRPCRPWHAPVLAPPTAALEVETEARPDRTPTDPRGTHLPDPAPRPREPDMGLHQNPGRTSTPRPPRRRLHHPTHPPQRWPQPRTPSQPRHPEVAGVPARPGIRTARRRLLPHRHRDPATAIRFLCHGGQYPHRPHPRRHHPPHRSLDHPARPQPARRPRPARLRLPLLAA